MNHSLGFEFKATHKGKETDQFYEALYMVNCDGEIIGYFLERDGMWKEANRDLYPYQVFPKISDLEKI